MKYVAVEIVFTEKEVPNGTLRIRGVLPAKVAEEFVKAARAGKDWQVVTDDPKAA